jgi:oligopeptide/dipeptide ABC transporter ATP-binding protein
LTNHRNPVLSVEELNVDITTESGTFQVLRNVSFNLYPGETLGIVGESGSGKTVTCLSLLKLLTAPPAVYRSGVVKYRSKDLWKMTEPELQNIRGGNIAMIFQEALSALNPVIKVGEQIAEVFTNHFGLTKPESEKRVATLLEKVGISDPSKRYHQYLHQLSGGLQQRIMFAMALAGDPSVLIADEPTTALDVTIQLQILELLRELQRDLGMSIIFISHDLGVIAEVCQRIIVMYAGSIVETGTADEIFSNPQHPYTRLLLQTMPGLEKQRGEFIPIAGQVPSLQNVPAGCNFRPRCPEAFEKCLDEPQLNRINSGQFVSCWRRFEEHC